MKVKKALISVFDKTGLEDFVKGLAKLNIEILSTGGTSKMIRSFGVSVTDVSSYTGFQEMLDGRVKTLNPKIHAGILADRDNKDHMNNLKNNEIFPIDMVVVNLYPFEYVISRKNVNMDLAIENIDIGGPTMMRSAAKNFKSVAVLSDPLQYEMVLQELQKNNCKIKDKTLKNLAVKAFERTSQYDSYIAEYFTETKKDANKHDFPNYLNVKMQKISQLRYGENPHQRAALYQEIPLIKGINVANLEKFQGKELSFNNISDLMSAISIVKDFTKPSVAIIKHNNPCAVASSKTLVQAYLDALDCDRMSAFGGIIGCNSTVDKNLAKVILDQGGFVECIIAPEYTKTALKEFTIKKNLRIVKIPDVIKNKNIEKEFKKIPGGALIQDQDNKKLYKKDFKVVTKTKPLEKFFEYFIFGCKVVRHVKSNAIILIDKTKTVGIGAGQMSRVDAVMIAINKAKEKAKGSILISDAFFPKPDSIDEAYKAGISTIVQPGGSIKDKDVIERCNKYNISMVFTGIRHFKH